MSKIGFQRSTVVKIIWIIAALIAVPIIIYIANFRTSQISSNPDDWGVFGDYLGGILNPMIALFNLGILSYLTYVIHKANEQRETENQKREIEKERPILIFKITPETSPNYLVKNVGNGPAINVEIFNSSNKDIWGIKVAGIYLMQNEEMRIDWAVGQTRFGAKYSDMFDKIHFSYATGNKMWFKDIEHHFNETVKDTKMIWEMRKKI